MQFRPAVRAWPGNVIQSFAEVFGDGSDFGPALVPQLATSGALRAFGAVRQSFASENGWAMSRILVDLGGLDAVVTETVRVRSVDGGLGEARMGRAAGVGFEPTGDLSAASDFQDCS
jgi:hypothetical protein